jgi:hypothetical protein
MVVVYHIDVLDWYQLEGHVDLGYHFLLHHPHVALQLLILTAVKILGAGQSTSAQ